MRVVTVCVGAPSNPALGAAIRDYESRASRYFRFEAIEVSGPGGRAGDPARVLRAEGEALLRRIPDGLRAIALTRSGRTLDSRALAAALGELATYGHPGAAFVIGGALGLDASVLARCETSLSLSPLTLPHELARLVLAEQLYRAGTILRGEPYHRG